MHLRSIRAILTDESMEIRTYHFAWEPRNDVDAYKVASFEGETHVEFAHLKGPPALPS